MRFVPAGGTKILAIVVTYYPNAEQLMELLILLANQVDSIFIVDNSDSKDDAVYQVVSGGGFTFDNVRIFRFGENKGIAAALNIGLELAFDEKFDFVLLSDQDSQPAPKMVEGLLSAYSELACEGVKVGAIGPTYTDLYTSLTHGFQSQVGGRVFYSKKGATNETPHVEALTLITSGTLIHVDVIRKVGGMREDFFIDHVDNEWCHRARGLGYKLFGTGWATMQQRMGGEKLYVWCFRWRIENEYDPIRIYYRLRNFVALVRVDVVDWRWKIRSAFYWAYVVYAHSLFSKKNPSRCFLLAIKGILHGCRGRMGPYSDS